MLCNNISLSCVRSLEYAVRRGLGCGIYVYIGHNGESAYKGGLEHFRFTDWAGPQNHQRTHSHIHTKLQRGFGAFTKREVSCRVLVCSNTATATRVIHSHKAQAREPFCR